jgi:hypothetical protein
LIAAAMVSGRTPMLAAACSGDNAIGHSRDLRARGMTILKVLQWGKAARPMPCRLHHRIYSRRVRRATGDLNHSKVLHQKKKMARYLIKGLGARRIFN